MEDNTTMASPKKTEKPAAKVAPMKPKKTKTGTAPKKAGKTATSKVEEVAPKKAPAAKAPKPTTKKPEFGSKTAFIKTQPSTMTAKEVVAAAKAQGITLSENLVYAARAGAKKAKGPKKANKGAKASSKSGPKPKKANSSKASSSLEATLRNAIAELGLAASRRVFEEVTAAFSGG